MVPSDFQSDPKTLEEEVSESDELKDYYEILNLEKNASNSDIRQSYFRLKNTYSHSNQALYSLLEEDDLQDSLGEIREAYDVLIEPESRLTYDKQLVSSGLAKQSDLCKQLHRSVELRKNQVADPGRSSGLKDHGISEPDLTKRSSTLRRDMAIQPLAGRQAAEIEPGHNFRFEAPDPREQGGGEPGSQALADSAPASTVIEMHKPGARKLIATKALDSGVQRKIQDLIEEGDLGDGALFRKIRLLVGVSQEEMQDHIKISIGYIKNLEENCFDLLPQEVYVKGFLKSYLRFLGVPGGDKLVNAYAERLKSWAETGRT